MRKQEESNRVLVLECSAVGIRNSDVREERRRTDLLVRPQQLRPGFAAFAAVTDKLVIPNFVWKLSLYHVTNNNEIAFVRIRDELATDHLDRQHPCVLKRCLVVAILFDQRHSYMNCAPFDSGRAVGDIRGKITQKRQGQTEQYCSDLISSTASAEKSPCKVKLKNAGNSSPSKPLSSKS
jgi:hypothetical protein